MAVMALVAAVSILFLPLLSLNVEDAAELMAAGDAGGSQEGGDEGQTSAEEMLSGFSFAVSLNGMDFVNIGFSGSLTGSLIDILSEAFSERADELVARALAAELSDSGIDEEVVSEIGGAFRGLEAAQTEEEIDAAVAALAQTLADSLGESASADTAELESGIREMYDDTVSHTGGVFTTEALICVTASGAMNGGEEGSGEVYTTFAELLGSSLESGEGGMVRPVSLRAFAHFPQKQTLYDVVRQTVRVLSLPDLRGSAADRGIARSRGRGGDGHALFAELDQRRVLRAPVADLRVLGFPDQAEDPPAEKRDRLNFT